MDLTERLQELAIQKDINYFGVANISKIKESFFNHGNNKISNYTYSITLGISLINDIVDQLPKRNEKSVAINYQHHAYDVINQRLDIVASIFSNFIQKLGYSVLPIPASKIIDDEKLNASFSHKMGARLSGLGWIGKSCLLITPDDGPRVRWATILTDAPIKPTGKPMEQLCGNCSACVDICPTKAFTGKPFHPEDPREVRYDAKKCAKYFENMKTKGQIDVCGMCLFVCPYGRKSNNNLKR